MTPVECGTVNPAGPTVMVFASDTMGCGNDELGGVLMRAQSVSRIGSAAIDLCYVACGRCEAFYEESLQPWDVAAGNLIVEEAGGRVTGFGNKPSSIFDQEFVATNGLIHKELLALLKEHWEEW